MLQNQRPAAIDDLTDGVIAFNKLDSRVLIGYVLHHGLQVNLAFQFVRRVDDGFAFQLRMQKKCFDHGSSNAKVLEFFMRTNVTHANSVFVVRAGIVHADYAHDAFVELGHQKSAEMKLIELFRLEESDRFF